MSTEPEGVWSGFTARRIRVSTQNSTPVTPTCPAGSQNILDVSTQSPLAESHVGSPAAGPSRLPGAPLLGFPDPTQAPAPTPVNPRTSPNNPFLSPRAASAPAGPAPESRDPPPHLPTPPAPYSDPQRELAQAMLLLAQTLRLTQASSAAPSGTPSSSERNNVREPDQFDGSDPSKLRSP
ncbi:hypothetical protein OH77DRAFT_1437438 [Trametes cingulata]|nr:hypothetical protein OH77DRAFT_1437438 [Trametes cingulata]